MGLSEIKRKERVSQKREKIKQKRIERKEERQEECKIWGKKTVIGREKKRERKTQ